MKKLSGLKNRALDNRISRKVSGAFKLAHLGLTFTFPTAEEFLAQQGLDPKLVQELAPGKRIYVRTDNLRGKFHSACDMGLRHMKSRYKEMVDPHNPRMIEGFSLPATKFKHLSKLNNVHWIYVTSQPVDKPDLDRHLSARDIYHQRILHEIRHCSDENQKMPHGPLMEGDCDYHAAEGMARSLNRPELREDLLLHQSFQNVGSHDTCLYMDAKFRGIEPPTAEDIQAANALFNKFYKKDPITDEDKAEMAAAPEWSKRRMGLFVAAINPAKYMGAYTRSLKKASNL